MSFMRKNPEIFPLSLGFHILTKVYFQGARCKTSQIFVILMNFELGKALPARSPTFSHL